MRNESPGHSKIATFVFLALLFLVPQVTSRAELQVTPRKITFRPKKDGSYIGSFRIINDSESRITFSIRSSDWEMSENGTVKLKPPGSTPNSLSPMISSYPSRVSVPPGKSKKVSFRASSPADRNRARWGAFLVRPLTEEAKNREGLHVGIKVQYAVTLYQTPLRKAEKRGKITRMSVSSPDNGRVSVKIYFKNKSPTYLRPTGSLTVQSEKGDIIMRKEIKEFLVLPGHLRSITQKLDSLEPGKYSATVILDFGGKEKIGARTTFNRD